LEGDVMSKSRWVLKLVEEAKAGEREDDIQPIFILEDEEKDMRKVTKYSIIRHPCEHQQFFCEEQIRKHGPELKWSRRGKQLTGK
jgi:hypothetical protein